MEEAPIVTVKNGKLRGGVAKNYNGAQFYCFKGIPFAKPPVGNLRFKAPLPADSWEGVKDATSHGNCCLSFDWISQKLIGSDDCLYLNVYTRELPSKSKSLKPVMVYVHGGAFTMGSGDSEIGGPEYLLTKDVVVVSFNYRLGLLGFSCFDDPSLDVPGNAGMKDQVLALKWVKENIEQFSGDPNNVTIFGISAGAASVHYLMISPLAKGLFQKCILQSGCVLCPWANGYKTLPLLTEALEKQNLKEKEAFDILQNMPLDELGQLQMKMKEDFEPSFKRCFAPTVEKSSPGAFLSEDPQKILSSGNYNPVPMIIGFTSREGIFANFYSEEAKSDFVVKNFESKIPCNWNVAKESTLSETVAKKIKSFYYGKKESGKDTEDQFYKMIGDALFEWPAIKSVKDHLKMSKTPIYLYRFSVDSAMSSLKKLFASSAKGACHGDDIVYIMTTCLSTPVEPNTSEEAVMKGMIEYWTNFAISGNPNSSSKSNSLIDWMPVDNHTLHYLEIGENFTVGKNPDANSMNFWEEITTLVNSKLQ